MFSTETRRENCTNPQLEAEIDCLRQAIDSIWSCILIVERDGRIKACNSAARKLANIESLKQKNLDEIMQELGIRWIAEALSDVVRTGKPFQAMDVECRTKNGERSMMNMRIHPYYAQMDSVQGAVLIIDDVTEQKMLERRLERSEKSASIGRLSANLAHELGNPLDGVLRYVRLLLDQMSEDDPGRIYAESARDGLLRVANMIRGLLDFARRSSSIPYPIDMPESIKQIFSSFADQISAQNVKIETEFDENIPVVLNIDVEQIFANMIKNAVQAMADGGTLSVDAKMLSPRLLEVRFSDTGSGFSDDIQDRIFEPFFTTKGFGQGVGLGLSISQEIVEKYGGSIEVESKLNEGTIFVVRLPIDENGLTIYQAESYATSAEELSVHTYY